MIPVSKIKYLAFEGGGGKGVAYLGAIEALEEKGVLPISDDNRQVLGISGSSTGAINALMLSLHINSSEIENELKNKNFEEFYTKDDPNNAIFRAVFTPRDKSNNPLKPGGFKNKNQIIVGYAVDSIKEEITEVNFGMCVSNFTTGFPVYFGHEWTPDFPVMEAVAASMTIPPAIKPLYNESDVVKPDDSKVKSINVQTDKGNIPFVGEQGKFELSDYYFYEHIVKLALAQEMAKPDGTGNSVNINVNSSIDLSTFLEELKNIVVEKKLKFKNENGIYTPQTVTNVSEIKTTLAEPVNGVTYTVDYTLYKFFYNAAYKGLFIDGGYRNNIPYNFFRTTDNKLDGVVAIKLDEHFPPDLMADVYNAIKAKLNKVETSEIIDDIDLSELDIPDIEMGAITELLNHAKTTTYKTTKADIITQTELVFSKYLTQWVSRAEDEEKKGKRREIINKEFRSRKGHKAVKRLVRSTLKTYRKQHLTPPWKKPKAILATAFEGYEYGSERGQVRHITDHNHILPLYDYGIGTYDFDMKKVMPMILLAQAQAEQDTSTFFK